MFEFCARLVIAGLLAFMAGAVPGMDFTATLKIVAVVVAVGAFGYELERRKTNGFTVTMYHELFHVWSRLHPAKSEQAYKLIGFESIGWNNLMLPAGLAARSRGERRRGSAGYRSDAGDAGSRRRHRRADRHRHPPRRACNA